MRSRQPIELVWLLVDLTHPMAGSLINDARTTHESKGNFRLSVNRSEDGHRALVKVAAGDDWHLTRPANAAILRRFTERDHHEAVKMVSAENWTPLIDETRRGTIRPL